MISDTHIKSTLKYLDYGALVYITQRVHIHYQYGTGPQNHNRDGFLEPNSIMVVHMDPLVIVLSS